MSTIKKFNIETGDLILFGGSNGIMGKLIRYFDKATYTHIGIAVWVLDKLFVLDMWTKGVELVPFEKRASVYPLQTVIKKTDILHSIIPKSIVSKLLEKWGRNNHIPYDYFLLPRIAIAKKLGIDFLAWGNKSKYTCSELAMEYFSIMVDQSEQIHQINLITPQDFVRYLPKGYKLYDIAI